MTFTERINEDLKFSMKAQNKERTETLRSLRSAMIELSKTGKNVSSDDEMKAILIQAKRRRDAYDAFISAGREDLVNKEKNELLIIEEYLPSQLTESEIRSEVESIIKNLNVSGIDSFKLVMPLAVSKMKGRASGSVIQSIVKELLS
ncbi:MAG: GatB/YqeY domain-containing protein [Chlorobiota bacterium]|nr:MAG: GatB/YqeY domain-containing protein [Chlorobiota bacterium]